MLIRKGHALLRPVHIGKPYQAALMVISHFDAGITQFTRGIDLTSLVEIIFSKQIAGRIIGTLLMRKQCRLDQVTRGIENLQIGYISFASLINSCFE